MLKDDTLGAFLRITTNIIDTGNFIANAATLDFIPKQLEEALPEDNTPLRKATGYERRFLLETFSEFLDLKGRISFEAILIMEIEVNLNKVAEIE